MSNTIKISAESTVEVTPRKLAEIFWAMDDTEQAAFFEELAHVVHQDDPTGLKGEMQFWFLTSRMKDNPVAAGVLRSMAAGLFVHTLRFLDRAYFERDFPGEQEGG